MRILANENFSADAVFVLRDHGHDVAWVRTDSPGIRDPEVLDRAQREERILITFDKPTYPSPGITCKKNCALIIHSSPAL